MASRSEILAALKGQRVRVPDLQALLQEWPQYTSPHLERLQIDVDAKLEELIPAGKRLQGMKKGNIAHFAATWWPYAEHEPLKYLAFLSIWLFNWDDETDSNEFSNMADHFDAEQRFRQDTLAFMRKCLSRTSKDGSANYKQGKGLTDSSQASVMVPESAGSSSSSSHLAADASPNSSSPSIGTSTEAPSPHISPRTSLITSASLNAPSAKKELKRSASSRKVRTAFVQHVRRPSSSPQIVVSTAAGTSESERNDVTPSASKPGLQTNSKLATGGKSRRSSIRKLASTIAKYLRPRKDSAVSMAGAETIVEESNEETETTGPPRSPLILSFETVADGVCPHFSPYEHRVFLQECEKFVNATEREQRLRVKGVLPSLEEYIAMRMDTGAVAMCLALHEYALAIQLPNSIRTDPDMAEIWVQANMVICIVNDMLSIKKEIAQGETDSLIPILVGQGKSLQEAMDHAFGMTQSAKWALDAAALRLSEKVSVSHDERVCEDVKRYVDSCRIACTGSTNWSVESGRYKLGVASLAGGVILSLE